MQQSGVTHLGSNRRFVLGISLDGKVQDRLLVFVLQQPVDDQRVLRIPRLDERTGDVPDPKLYTGSDLESKPRKGYQPFVSQPHFNQLRK
jgi:hypothetical protein